MKGKNLLFLLYTFGSTTVCQFNCCFPFTIKVYFLKEEFAPVGANSFLKEKTQQVQILSFKSRSLYPGSV